MDKDVICLCGRRKGRSDTALGASVCFPVLSQNEAEVLRSIAAGKENSDIAMALSLSKRAITNHIKSVLSKARAKSKADMIPSPNEETAIPMQSRYFGGNQT